MLAISGCGDDGENGTVDSGPVTPPPRIIPGGGIGDGPIDGVANVYVIDDALRMGVAGATVRVGDIEGTTDSTGLFIAEGVTGPQTVVVKATNFRSEMWLGANGTNMTFALEPSAELTPASGTLSGAVNLSAITLAAGHTKFVTVGYSQTDDLGDPANEISTASNGNLCHSGITAGVNNQPCNFTITTRTGRIALLAAVYDRDLNGTPGMLDDDTMTLIRWAYRSNITVAANANMPNADLSLIDPTNLGNLTVDFGSPPAALGTVGALIGIDAGDDGIFQLPLFRTPSMTTVLAPTLAAFSGATGFQLVAVSNNGTDPATTESIVLRKGLQGPTLAAGTWLAPPASVMVSRTGASWGTVAGATVHSVEFEQGTARLLNVTSFDAAITQFTVPSLVALPQGALTAKVNAIGATGLDVTNFSLDTDADKLDQVSAQTIALP